MGNLYDILLGVLKKDEKYFASNGELLKNAV